MKDRNAVCTMVALFFTVSALGQVPRPTSLEDCLRLQELGRSSEAVQALTIFLGDHRSSSSPEIGTALNALGSAYQDLEQYGEARQSYDRAITLLRTGKGQERRYAEALDNLGSLELRLGHPQEARHLRSQAQRLYTSVHDDAGVSRTANNLAVIAYEEDKSRKAAGYLEQAFRHAEHTANITDDDLASMWNLRGRLAERRRDFSSAVAAQHQALSLWEKAYSSPSVKVVVGYVSLASAEAGSGDVGQALMDVKRALAVEEQRPAGRKSPEYAEIEMVYARVLKLSGEHTEAALITADAQARLQTVNANGGVVSVSGLR